MKPRQTVPEQWLIVDHSGGEPLWREVEKLAPGSGVVLITELSSRQRRRLRHITRSRGLILAAEKSGEAARVHNLRELTKASLRRTPLILLSPLNRTRTHPDWRPLPRMRAAALARLAGRQALALGGMDERRYAKLAPLGFIGWAGISAFKT